VQLVEEDSTDDLPPLAEGADNSSWFSPDSGATKVRR
jgi:hypothetical protein